MAKPPKGPKPEPHSFAMLYKGYPWAVCRHCGLVKLKNRISEWCASRDCNYKDLAPYKRWLTTGDVP